MHRLPPATTFTAEKHPSDTSGLSALGGTFDPPTALTSDVLVGYSTPDLGRVSTGSFFTFPISPTLEGSEVLGITAIASASAARSGIYVLTSSVNVSGGGHLYRLTRTPNSLGGTVSSATLLDTFFGQESLSPNDSIGVIVAEARVLGATQGVNNIYRRGFVPDEALDLGEDWNAVSTDVGGDLVLLSNFGDLALKTPSSSTFEFHRGPYLVVQGAEGRGGTGVLVAGQDNNGDGALERYSSNGGVPTFAPVSVSAPGVSFHGVCRVSDAEAWAVGSLGTVAAINGLSASLATSGTQKDLMAVSCPAPGVAIACGQDGTVLRLSGGAWSPVSPAFPMTRVITSCALVGGAIYAAGDGFFQRLDPGAASWTALPGRAGLDNLVVRSVNDVYASSQAVASNTSDVVHFDGTRWATLTTVSGSLRGGMQVGAKVVYGGSSGVLVEGR